MHVDSVVRLGHEIERRWLLTDYDPRHFSDVAARALAESDLPSKLTPDDVVDWAFGALTLPKQETLPATFGQPPVTLFRSRRFYIEALFWIDGSTSIHQHAFSGAFQVLEGSSIETRYAFEPNRAFDGHFVLGTLRTDSTSLLRKGDVRPIVSGMNGVVHALFHLERPSVTIVVRTFHDAGVGPQFNYARPGVGLNPFFKEETTDRALELVTLLFRTEHPALETKVGDLVARSDLHAAYRILLECAGFGDRPLLNRLIERIRDRNVVATFRAALEEGRRLRFLLSRRSLVTDPELRFFLGVLLNAHRREDVLTLVRARVPTADPGAQSAAWLRRLSTTSLKLQAAGAAWQANVLGLPEMNDALELSLARALAGIAPSGDASEARFLLTLREIPAVAALFA